MITDVSEIGLHKVKNLRSDEIVELSSFWKDQNVAIIFFRRWGCMLCRLWAKEKEINSFQTRPKWMYHHQPALAHCWTKASRKGQWMYIMGDWQKVFCLEPYRIILAEITQILKKHNINVVGVGVEEAGAKDFINGNFFDGDLYCVENLATYQTLGFKRFNVVSIITSLFWKQSRDAIFKGKHMGLGGDLKGDWVQTGGALLVERGGNLIRHFVQTGPGDHLPNQEILKHFGLENEYKDSTMGNTTREGLKCDIEAKS